VYIEARKRRSGGRYDRTGKTTESFKSIAGAALIGIGLHILSGSLDTTAIRASQILGVIANHAPRVLAPVLLTVSQAVQAYAAGHQGCLLALLRILISFWSLLLVIVGVTFLGDTITEEIKALPTSTNYFQNRHLSNIFQNQRYWMSISFSVVRRIDRAEVQPVKTGRNRLTTQHSL
jgi:hypothetical protein